MEQFPRDTQACLNPSLLSSRVINIEKPQTAFGCPLVQSQHAQNMEDTQQPPYNRPAIFNPTQGSSKRQRSDSDESSKSPEDEIFDLLLIAPPDAIKKVISRLLSKLELDDVMTILKYLQSAVRLSSPSFAGSTTISFGISSSSKDTLQSAQTLRYSHDQHVVPECADFEAIQEYSDAMNSHNDFNVLPNTDVVSQEIFDIDADLLRPHDLNETFIALSNSNLSTYSDTSQLDLRNSFDFQAPNVFWDPKHGSTSSYSSIGSVFDPASNRSSTSTMASQVSRRPPNRVMSTSNASASLKSSSSTAKASRSSSGTRKSINAKFACSQDGCLSTFTRDEDRVRHEQDIHNPNGKYTCLLDTCSSFCPPDCQNDHHISPFQPCRKDKMKAHLKAHGWNISQTNIPPCWRGQYKHHKTGWSCKCGQQLGSWLDNEKFIKQHFESHNVGDQMQIDVSGGSERTSEEMEVLEKRLSQTSLEMPKYPVLDFNHIPTNRRLHDPPSEEDFDGGLFD